MTLEISTVDDQLYTNNRPLSEIVTLGGLLCISEPLGDIHVIPLIPVPRNSQLITAISPWFTAIFDGDMTLASGTIYKNYNYNTQTLYMHHNNMTLILMKSKTSTMKYQLTELGTF